MGAEWGFGGDFTRGSRPLLEEWVQVACSPYCACGKPNARSSGSPLLVREDGRGIKVNTPGIPQLGGRVEGRFKWLMHYMLFFQLQVSF